jgi:hypothetical protein
MDLLEKFAPKKKKNKTLVLTLGSPPEKGERKEKKRKPWY